MTDEAGRVASPLTEGLGLAPEREGQARTLFIAPGNPDGDIAEEIGHWYSPAAVREMIDAAVAAERKKHMTDTQIAEFGALCVMNRRLKLTAREMLREYKADRGIEA